jgi:hypothetical protein
MHKMPRCITGREKAHLLHNLSDGLSPRMEAEEIQRREEEIRHRSGYLAECVEQAVKS